MRDVYVIGIGQLPVTKQTDLRVRDLGAQAVKAAMEDAGVGDPTALFVGNMMSGILSDQQHLGPLVADAAGLRGIEAMTVESCCGSGGASMRWGYMAVAGGMHDVVVVSGVEKMTHTPRPETTHALATASDWESEGAHGETFVTLNTQLMIAYMEKYGVDPMVFAPFSITAHRNALTNPNALLHKHVDEEVYRSSKLINGPMRLYDASPICNGAAAVVLASGDAAKAYKGPKIKVTGSSMATDSVGIADRRELLALDAVKMSSERAYKQSGYGPDDIDIFELHDAYTIMSVLSLEAAGFADPGTGWRLGESGAITLKGDTPMATFGGLKSAAIPSARPGSTRS